MSSLFADMGGTNVRFGYSKTENSSIIFTETYKVRNFSTVEDAIKLYCSNNSISPQTLSFCVAAPTNKNSIIFTNNHWTMKKDVLRDTLGSKNILCINDFTAQALSQTPYFKNRSDKKIPDSTSSSTSFIKKFSEGNPDHASPIFIIGPGTGLGASTLVCIENAFKALQAEGGHTHFSPTSEIELELLIWLQKKLGPVSTENVVSGSGLENIYQFLSYRKSKSNGSKIRAERIGTLALKGDPLSLEAVNLMLGALGTATANGVLITGSFRGAIICGGIIPKLSKLLSKSPFYDKFIYNKPSYSNLLRQVPIYISNDPFSGLKGCQQAFQNKFLKSEINRFSYD
tara:strand:+ start:5101 stop:6129 length:1029 start_codon:yes stop_codon:yes gene_type:complete